MSLFISEDHSLAHSYRLQENLRPAANLFFHLRFAYERAKHLTSHFETFLDIQGSAKRLEDFVKQQPSRARQNS